MACWTSIFYNRFDTHKNVLADSARHLVHSPILVIGRIDFSTRIGDSVFCHIDSNDTEKHVFISVFRIIPSLTDYVSDGGNFIKNL